MYIITVDTYTLNNMSNQSVNIATLVLNRIRLESLTTLPDDSWNSCVKDAMAGQKILVTNDDENITNFNKLFQMEFVKLRPDAVIPTKATDGSVGFDLTLLGIRNVCAEDNQVIYCHTGLKVKPPMGFYSKIYPRSSIIKSGFDLANSVGIIDVDYRGELLVALRRHKSDAELTFPCKLVQLLPELDHSYIVSVEVTELDETVRGEGGFGSTGK
ncbi:desoxyuridine 5'-triphosphate nucleotidohydrolase [Faustovirus ST1]|nr:desoxyuridine 5'-triphosphate nucleotidohydrolase [Faustovirus ST1]